MIQVSDEEHPIAMGFGSSYETITETAANSGSFESRYHRCQHGHSAQVVNKGVDQLKPSKKSTTS